jgi:putative acetyltransferase
MKRSAVSIVDARDPDDMDQVRAMFREYREQVGDCSCFEGFEDELHTLPGGYVPPGGCLLLARDGDELAGGIAMLPLTDGACEMRRLYVRARWRGTGLGRRLVSTLLDHARAAGHARMVLETLPRMAEARALYASLGFVEAPRWQGDPVEDNIYMRLDLVP